MTAAPTMRSMRENGLRRRAPRVGKLRVDAIERPANHRGFRGSGRAQPIRRARHRGPPRSRSSRCSKSRTRTVASGSSVSSGTRITSSPIGSAFSRSRTEVRHEVGQLVVASELSAPARPGGPGTPRTVDLPVGTHEEVEVEAVAAPGARPVELPRLEARDRCRGCSRRCVRHPRRDLLEALCCSAGRRAGRRSG